MVQTQTSLQLAGVPLVTRAVGRGPKDRTLCDNPIQRFHAGLDSARGCELSAPVLCELSNTYEAFIFLINLVAGRLQWVFSFSPPRSLCGGGSPVCGFGAYCCLH